MVGSAIKRKLESRGYTNILTRRHSEFDLTNQQAVNEFFKAERQEYVFLAAAKVGGIMANSTYPADFIYGVKKLLFLGSSCIYPKRAPQPLKEEYLLTGELEVTKLHKLVGWQGKISLRDGIKQAYEIIKRIWQ